MASGIVPIFQSFRITGSKFHIVDFNHKYDGFIGMYLLHEREAVVNIHQSLIPLSAKITIKYDDNALIALKCNQQKIFIEVNTQKFQC